MTRHSWFGRSWRLVVCGLAFFIGVMLGNMAAGLTGIPAPALPTGADPAMLMWLTLAGSLLVALALSLVACNLAGGFVARWLILAFFLWVVHGVNTYIEAAIFTTMSAASPYTVVMYLVAALLTGAAVAWLFPPDAPSSSFPARLRPYFATHTLAGWAWRLLAALLAFPAAYLFFGTLIAPLVTAAYREGVAELALPGWGQIVPALFLRSLLFLLACLPVLIAWQGSRQRLFWVLGLALFLLVGGVAMLQAHWFPAYLRVVHTLEMLAGEFVYAGALVLLLAGPAGQAAPGDSRTQAHPVGEGI